MYVYLAKCDYPDGLKIVHIIYVHADTNSVLFSNFYVKSGTKKKVLMVIKTPIAASI